MRKYMLGNIALFTIVSLIFGTLFYLRNYEQFDNTNLNLAKGFNNYFDNSMLVNSVSSCLYFKFRFTIF